MTSKNFEAKILLIENRSGMYINIHEHWKRREMIFAGQKSKKASLIFIRCDVLYKHTRNRHVGEDLGDVFETVHKAKWFWITRNDNG